MGIVVYKNIISKIKVAKENNNNKVLLKVYNKYRVLLDFLWKEGLIYGYVKVTKHVYCVFLKYTLRGFIKKFQFIKYKASYKKIKKIKMYETSCLCCIKAGNKIYSQKDCIHNGLGGYIFISV